MFHGIPEIQFFAIVDDREIGYQALEVFVDNGYDHSFSSGSSKAN